MMHCWARKDTGVFSLNTKHHKKAAIWVAGNVFMVNGQRQPTSTRVDTRPDASEGS
jgi:hypothetical protein